MAKTIDDMKDELEANGYEFVAPDVHGGYGHIITNDGLKLHWDYDDNENNIRKAYAHLQKQRELEALRSYVLQLNKASEEVKRFDGKTSNPLDVATKELFLVANRAFAYIDAYNITTDESDPDE